MKERYFTHKELKEIAVEFTLISLGLAGIILFYSSIRVKEIFYITLILGGIYGTLLSLQVYKVGRIKKIHPKELIINISLLAVPFLIINYITVYLKDFTIAIVYISSALLSGGFCLLLIRWKSWLK